MTIIPGMRIKITTMITAMVMAGTITALMAMTTRMITTIPTPRR